MTHFYEILENDLGLLTRKGWAQSDAPLTITQAARVLMSYDASLARELAENVNVKREIAHKTPNCALFVCTRKGKSSFMVYEWPEADYNRAKREYHRVETV